MYLPLSLFLPLRPHLKHRLSEIVFALPAFDSRRVASRESSDFGVSLVCGMASCNKFDTAFAIRHAHKLPPYKLYNFPCSTVCMGEIYTSKKRFCLHRLCTAFAGANLSYGLYSINLDKKLDNIYPQIDVICAQDSLEGREKSHRKALDSARSYLSIMESCWRWGTDLVLLPETAVSKDYDEQLKKNFPLYQTLPPPMGVLL